jgi:uncharacterized protein YcbK (DUF882 family)
MDKESGRILEKLAEMSITQDYIKLTTTDIAKNLSELTERVRSAETSITRLQVICGFIITIMASIGAWFLGKINVF